MGQQSTSPAAAVATRTDDTMSSTARRAVLGVFFGYFVDFYDIYLPTIALAPAITYFQPKDLGVVASTTIFYLTFAVTLIGRPIGAFIFGHLADSISRKTATMIAVGGFGVVTLLIAFLPGFGTWGWASLILLIVLRLIDGIFLGGEYTSAVPLVMEHAPRARRGRISARIMLGYPSAFVLLSLLVIVILKAGPAGNFYATWGWRIPFVVGALLSVVFFFIFRGVEDPAAVGTGKGGKSPLRMLFSPGPARRSLVQVFILMSGMWLSLEAVVAVLPGLLTNVLKLPSSTVSTGILVTFAVLAPVYVLVGRLADRYGRKPTLLVFGVLITVVVPVGFWLLVATSHRGGDHLHTLVLGGLLVLMTNGPWALLSAYIPERFPPHIRASGFGVGYTLAVLLPSCYSFFLVWLAHLMPYAYTQIPLVILGGLLILAGTAMGPETQGIDLVDYPTQVTTARR